MGVWEERNKEAEYLKKISESSSDLDQNYRVRCFTSSINYYILSASGHYSGLVMWVKRAGAK